MSEVIKAIKMDQEIQEIMNRIMLDELKIDETLIANRSAMLKVCENH